MDFKRIFWLIMTPLFLSGFRVIPRGNLWSISSSSVATSKIFLKYSDPSTTIENDLPEGDPLHGTATVTIQEVMNSVINDYNSIQGTFLTLADENDTDFAAESTNRIITIENGAAIGLTSGGYAKSSWNGSIIDGCTIVLKSEVFEKAKRLAFSVTHELGHCFGLHHPMDTVNSIMSYYVNQNSVIRLQPDDKMGIVYLYPNDPKKVQEEATLGFGCTRKQ